MTYLNPSYRFQNANQPLRGLNDWSKLSLVTPPSGRLFALTDAKDQLYIDQDVTQQDNYIMGLIDAATAYAEGPNAFGRVFLTQQWQLTIENLYPMYAYDTLVPPQVFGNARHVTVPLTPVQSIDQIEVIDVNNVSTVLVPSTYIVDTTVRPTYIRFINDLPIGRLKILFTAGYGDDPSTVPADIIQAVKMLMASWYQDAYDTASSKIHAHPRGFDRIMAKYRNGL